MEESLDNLRVPLDLKWSKSGERSIQIVPYEYHRRGVQEGAKLLEYLSSKYNTIDLWEQRREELREEVLSMLGMDRIIDACSKSPNVVMGKVVRHNGYTTQNYALETLQGLYVCGTIYAPIKKGKHPLIVSPAGHWAHGRYREDQQMRMATFARMGAVAVDLDIFAWGDSQKQLGVETHQAPYAMQMQLLFSKVVTDWITSSGRNLDLTRVGVTGGSGGATHTLLLAMLDGRFTAVAPVAHLVSHFDGGCPCESAIPVSLAGGGSCMTELLATLSPTPVRGVSDGGDWTDTYPGLEYPYLRGVWSL